MLTMLKTRAAILSILLLLVVQSAGLCQHEAVGLLTRDDGASGSCVVVEKYQKLDDGWLGYAVTAHHVVESSVAVKVTYFTGRRAMNCPVVASDKAADLAIIRVWVPDEVVPVEVDTEVNRGDLVLFGYPSGVFGKLGGSYLRSNGTNIYLDILVRPGFSGGGVFRERKLVGCISGGWFWTTDEEGRQATWPTRAAHGRAIADILKRAKQKPEPQE